MDKGLLSLSSPSLFLLNVFDFAISGNWHLTRLLNHLLGGGHLLDDDTLPTPGCI